MKFIKKHKKLIMLILTIISIFFIYKINNKNNINYTTIGDGFSVGIDSYGVIDYGYSDYIKDYLEKNNKLNRYIKSFSYQNISIETLYEQILSNKKLKLGEEEINIRKTLRETNILTLSIGLNDLLYQFNITKEQTPNSINSALKEIEKNFNNLIDEIKKYYPKEIYVMGYYNVILENEQLNKAIKSLNKIYEKNENVIYVPTYELFKNNPSFCSNPNSIYPNRIGYQAIANEFIVKISKKLEK